MIGRIRNLFGTESRSSEIDVGALYAAAFQFGSGSYSWARSPALLVSSLSLPDAAGDSTGVLLTESRRLSRSSPLLIAYRSVIECGILTGSPEAPEFSEDVPENVATAVADLWLDAHDCDTERDLLDRVVVDGEFLILDGGQIVTADGFTPATSGPAWNQEVTGYVIGRASRPRNSGLRYIGDRPMGAARALPWTAPALPSAAGLLNARTGAGHAIGTMAKIAAVVSAASTDRITATPGARSGLVETDATGADTDRRPIHALGVGSVPYLRNNESVDRIEAGPDETARKYESQLERDVASALNMPLSELLSDYSSGSFSNLRMAWADAEQEKARRRSWWHRRYRLPQYLDLVSTAFAAGRLPRMSQAVMAAIKRPAWRGPKRQPPQPEKEAAVLATLVEKGILDAAAAREKLE